MQMGQIGQTSYELSRSLFLSNATSSSRVHAGYSYGVSSSILPGAMPPGAILPGWSSGVCSSTDDSSVLLSSILPGAIPPGRVCESGRSCCSLFVSSVVIMPTLSCARRSTPAIRPLSSGEFVAFVGSGCFCYVRLQVVQHLLWLMRSSVLQTRLSSLCLSPRLCHFANGLHKIKIPL